MAKLRRNHAGKGRGMGAQSITKVGIFGAILAALIWGFNTFSANGEAGPQVQRIDYTGSARMLPHGSAGELIEHTAFTLSYNEEWEQAEWVAYLLEREKLQREWTDRPRNFFADQKVSTGSAADGDYRGSGYDRGHLAPFADFAYDAELARETFNMSNISPQARQFNQGVWRELEELTRDWAKRFKRLYVVTGPVITQRPKGTIGRSNRVAVPAAYFKVLLDLDDPEQKAIGFVIPNEISFDPLPEYALSVDEVETLTGLDFFADLLPADVEADLESRGNPDLWPFSKKKYDKRIKSWNNVRH